MEFKNRRLGGTVLALALLSGLCTPAMAQASNEIDFGDDTSAWANDGECDDPRFEGAGMAAELLAEDRLHDATDCRTAYEAGEITLVETTTTAAAEAPPAREIDFGDDSGEWANDGECDDPRFIGPGSAEELEDIDIGKDATDCRVAFEAGTVTLADENKTAAEAIDFGDDSSEWANDLECDDPRFKGPGMAANPSDEDILRDATDCRNAFNDGTISLDDRAATAASTSGGANADWMNLIADRIDFGDDTSEWANDDECDDPDFTGPGAVSDPSEEDRFADATDCRAAFIAGTVTLRSLDQPASAGSYNYGAGSAFNYGNNSSDWANDGQCDDMRFTGPGMAKKLSSDDIAGDASDCRMLEEAGEISIRPVYTPEYAAGAPYDSSAVDFGDNSSSWADDNQCDDPRFEGPGVAETLLESDRLADANDCKAAFEAGTAVLRDGES